MINENLLRRVASTKFLRGMIIFLLRISSRDISIKNPYSGKKMILNSYLHKGYWYFKKYREEATINSIRKILNCGDIVIEVGGHIGFISHLYSTIVGAQGRVFVFEPGDNNLTYTRKNVNNLENVELTEKGCGNIKGIHKFYKDRNSGQNNSLLPDYENVESVALSHNLEAVRVVSSIEVITLEDFISSKNIFINHIKIDVEGFELNVLQGLNDNLGKIPSFMVEVTREAEAVYSLMRESGYIAYDDKLNRLDDKDVLTGNIFFILSSQEIVRVTNVWE